MMASETFLLKNAESKRGEAESLERTINEKEAKCSNVKCSVPVFVFVNGDELSSS